jgi:hypothetical protein
MPKYTHPLILPLALSMALVAGGCRSNDDDRLAQDTTLASDLQLANQDSAAQPQLRDVPAAEAESPAPATKAPATGTARTPTRTTPRASTPPRTTTPTPATTPSGNRVETGARGSEGRLATIGAGTSITLTSGSRVCTNTYKAGDKFTATVAETIRGDNGAVIPAGATAVVQVTSVKRSENVNDPAQIGLAVQYINVGGKSYPVDAAITSAQVDRVRESTTGNDAKKVIGGAVAGAVIGQILGKDTKSTVIGAATGAAAGTAVAMGTADYAGCIPQGGRIVIKLNSPATIQAE